jgi:3-phosphoshikimate 1-carboxyvinyltransferase
MTARCINPAKGPVDADFQAVPSKSATHRALIAAGLSDGRSTIVGPLHAEDTRRTREGLEALGIAVEESPDGTWSVTGCAGRVQGGARLECGASGTSARFLTAIAALGEAPSIVDGSERLRQRPMGELVRALGAVGAAIEARDGDRLPLRAGGRVPRGGAVSLSGARSSQFASALLLAAPATAEGVRLTVEPPLASFSYVLMTVATLEAFGVEVLREGAAEFRIGPQRIKPARVIVEGDHSSASYLFAAAMILGGEIRMSGLSRASLQPDARFLRELEALGCAVSERNEVVTVRGSGRVPPFAWDLEDAPDLAPTACALALFAEGRCLLSGLSNLRHKESDRLAILAANARRLGASVTVEGGTLALEPASGGPARGAWIDAAGDHRIAMAFAIAGLRGGHPTISDPDVVAKSYPGFWRDFDTLTSGDSNRLSSSDRARDS